MKRVLIITAHLDDVEFGMGGYLINSNEKIKVITFCKGRDEINSHERLLTAFNLSQKYNYDLNVIGYYDMELENILLKDITKIIENEIQDFNPDKVFTVHENDIHQDHKIISHATKIACRPGKNNIKEIYEFKIPGSQPFNKTYFDTIYKLKKNTYNSKQKMCLKYKTENIPDFSDREYFKTIYREF